MPRDFEAHRERVYAAHCRLGDLIDAVVAADREVQTAIARRTELLDAAREWARSMTDEVLLRPVEGQDRNLSERAMVSELACALRLPERTTTGLVREAEILVHSHAATFAALQDGQISYRHAQVILDATITADKADRPALEQRLLERAADSTAARLNRFALRERERLHPEQAVERHTREVAERCVYLDPERDGMAWLSAYLPAVQATAVFNRLNDVGASLQGPHEKRTLPQLRADILASLILDDGAPAAAAGLTESTTGISDSSESSDFTPSFRGIRPTVAVTVSAETLLGRSDAPGELEGYGPIDPVSARRIAAQAPSFLRLLTHPETGAVLSVGRDRYAVPADLKSWLRVRDETCRFPGCARRAQRCDIDHITAWVAGGATDHDNLIHLCRHHHRLKHMTRWKVERVNPIGESIPTTLNDPGAGERPGPVDDADSDAKPPGTNAPVTEPPDGARPAGRSSAPSGTVRWTAPSGRTYVTEPALALNPCGPSLTVPRSGAPHATQAMDKGTPRNPAFAGASVPSGASPEYDVPPF
jgi:Domain of unknown function (DUF222)/HNH endonuclease